MPGWLVAFRRYILVAAVGNAVWEIAQLPLYSVWDNGTPRQIVFDVLHCTAGDVLIAANSLLAALLLVGRSTWPSAAVARTIAIVLAAGLAYTTYSEYLNTVVRGAWSYSNFMPRLPWLGIGLSPLAQWLIVPSLALFAATRSHRVARTSVSEGTADAGGCPSSLARPQRLANLIP